MAANPKAYQIDVELPLPLQAAARDYVTDAVYAADEPRCGHEANMRRLFAAFGELTAGNAAHRRATWLCVLAMRRILSRRGSSWVVHGSDLHAVIDVIEGWVVTGAAPGDWTSLGRSRVPAAQGGTTRDEDEVLCDATAALARFCVGCAVPDAVTALHGAWVCDDKQARWVRTEMLFDDWLVTVALPAAWNLSDVSHEHLHPPILAADPYPRS